MIRAWRWLALTFAMLFGVPMQERVTVRGRLVLQLLGPDGQLKTTRVVNTITTYGKESIADFILAAPTRVKPGWMAIGTGSPAATLLGAEVARVAFDTKTRSGAIVTMVATFAAGTGTGTITEAGIFDVVTANTVNMDSYTSFGAVTKGALDSIVGTWTWTVA